MSDSNISYSVFSGVYDALTHDVEYEKRCDYIEKLIKKHMTYSPELVADLGLEWEARTGLPLPLGGIVIRRDVPMDVQHRFEKLLRSSIEYAFANPMTSREFVKQHAQELEDDVIDKHISLFVNDFSLSLGDEGRRAMQALTGLQEV